MSSFAEPTPAFAQALAVDNGTPNKAIPADAFNRARELVHAGVRLDMVALAAELGISRATLYRWTGDRERLLSDVFWADVRALLEYVHGTTSERGAEGMRLQITQFLQLLTGGEMLKTILQTEGDVAFRLFTDLRGGVHPRIVALIAGWIQDEIDAGLYTAPEEPRLLAEGVVTVCERFLYHGGDWEANPDPETANRIIALMIREP